MNKLDLTNEQLFDKVEKHELVICHLKHSDGSMTPFLVDINHVRYEMPEGYMEYDKKHFRRRFNI
jgi:hypothetical protein